LTPAQATQMKAIFASMPRRHRRHRDSDESATPDPSAAESRRANREAVEAKIKAVLTPEQWTKYEAMRSHRRHHARPRESE
jgi:Spy/CpxP family protein refolding chaperone